MKDQFRLIGICGLFVGIICRFNPTLFLPSTMRWSGEFALSRWGILLGAICDLSDIVIMSSVILLILACTKVVGEEVQRVTAKSQPNADRSWDDFIGDRK